MDTSKTGKRRYRSVELKRQIVEETFEGGVSVAVVARRHGVNANQVFSWRRQYQRGELVAAIQEARDVPLLPVQVREAPVRQTPMSSCKNEPSSAEDCLEIEFPGGRHLRVWGRTDVECVFRRS